MKKLSLILTGILTALILIGSAYAKFAKPSEAIQYRKAVMVLIQQHFKEMGAVVKGKSDYDKETFSANADVLKMLATLPWEAFTTSGSDKGKTSMSSSVFKKKAQFLELTENFETATAELAATAQGGDLKAIRGQFGKVAQICGSCHKNFQK
ncbi:MAG: cytochrome c [Desulfobacterales bacterium]|nr:cytochrome c [Desulfobacterales bacterium]